MRMIREKIIIVLAIIQYSGIDQIGRYLIDCSVLNATQFLQQQQQIVPPVALN